MLLRKCFWMVCVLVVLMGCEKNPEKNSTVPEPSPSVLDPILTLRPSPTPVPTLTDTGRFLGMENGSVMLSDKNIDQFAELLNLDTSMPTIVGIYYANGVYLALTKSGDIYVTKDLKEWKKTMKPGHRILADPSNGFVLIHYGEYSFSKDGENWKPIEGMGRFFKEPMGEYEMISQVFFKNKVIAFDHKRENKTEQFGDFTAIYTKDYTSFINDGEMLLALDNLWEEGDEYECYTNRVHYSLDGVKWKATDAYTSYGYYSSINVIPNYQDKRILETYTYDCGETYFYYSYKKKGDGVSFVKEEKLKHFNGDLTLEKSFFNLCISYHGFSNGGVFLDKGIYSDVFKKNGFLGDMLLLQDFIGDVESEKMNVDIVNGKCYYYGKYGGIIEIDPKLNFKWVGLYPRETWTKEDMENPELGGKIGIVEKDGLLWYANTGESNEFRMPCEVYSSRDGVHWKFEFEDKAKINVNSLSVKGKSEAE